MHRGCNIRSVERHLGARDDPVATRQDNIVQPQPQAQVAGPAPRHKDVIG